MSYCKCVKCNNSVYVCMRLTTKKEILSQGKSRIFIIFLTHFSDELVICPFPEAYYYFFSDHNVINYWYIAYRIEI